MSGKKILCTRPVEGAEEFKRILEMSGAEVLNIPMIEIHPCPDTAQLDEKIDSLDKYSGLIFTSSNGVKYFFKRVIEKNIKPVNRIYAVGEKTKLSIESLGYNVNAVPENYNSDALSEMLLDSGKEDSSYLFPTGNLSMKGIVIGMKNVDEIIVYETRKPEKSQLMFDLESMFNKDKIDCIAFFSPSAVSNFTELFPGYSNFNADIAVIGKTTSARTEYFGLKADIIAKKPTAECLAEEIINYYYEG